MLHIYKGRESAEKRRILYERIASQGTFSTLITPSQNTLSLEKEYLEMTGKRGIFFEEVTSFERMRARLTMDIFSGNEFITQAGERILLSQMLREKRRDLPILGKVAHREGLLEALRDLFGRFQREGVRLQDLENILSEESDSLSHRRLADVHTLYSFYLERLRDRYIDIHQSVELFESEGHRFSLYSPHSVWVLGYKNLGLPEIRMLQAMEAHTGAIHLSLPCEEEELYAPVLEQIHRLKDYFSHVREETIDSPDTSLRQFARGMVGLTYSGDAFPVDVLEAKDPYREAEYIGLDILKRMREDRSLRLEDVRILCSDMTRYGPVFTDVFSMLGIALFRDERRLILHTRIIKAVFSLLRAMQKGFPADLTINYLKHIVPPGRWEALDIFENTVLVEGISHDAFYGPFANEAEMIRQEYLALPMRFVKESLPKSASTRVFAERILGLLKDLHFEDHIKQEAQEYQADAHFEEAMVLSQIWNTFYETMEQLSAISTEETISFSRFLTRLQTALGSLTVGILPPSGGEVFLADLSRSLASPIRLLYICGVNEGVLPATYSHHLLLEESQREAIARWVPGYTDLSALRERGEELDFYNQICLTQDHVFMSYALSDMEGEAKLPSLYIDRAVEMTGGQLISGASEGYLEDHYYLNEAMSLRYAMDAYAQRKAGVVHGITQEALDMRIEKLHASDSPGPIVRGVEGPLRTSATALETFSSCPFRYFLRHDLKAERRKEFRMEAVDLGSFYHAVVEEIVKDMQQEGFDLDRALEEHIGELLKKKRFAPFRENAASQYFLERARAVCRFVLETIQGHLGNSEFQPTSFEQELYLEGEHFFLYGVADRIDQKDQYFVLIDYKSGKKTFDYAKVYLGIDLQLSLYTKALTQDEKKSVGSFFFRIFEPVATSDNPEDERKEMMKWSGALLADVAIAKSLDKNLKDGTSSAVLPVTLKMDGEFKYGSSVLTEGEYEALLNAALSHAEDHADRIVWGDVSVAPLELSGKVIPCQYCDYTSVCRFEKRSAKYETRKVESLTKSQVLSELRGGEK